MVLRVTLFEWMLVDTWVLQNSPELKARNCWFIKIEGWLPMIGSHPSIFIERMNWTITNHHPIP